MGEYAIVVAGIAVACVFLALFLGRGIGDLFGSSTPAGGGTFTPPTTTPAPASPTTPEDCEHGGWQLFVNPSFTSESDCKTYVANLP